MRPLQSGVEANQLQRPLEDLIGDNAELLTSQLTTLRNRLFAPSARKELRTFSSSEAARLIGVTDGRLRQVAGADDGPIPEKGPGGRHLYTLRQIDEVRRYLSRSRNSYIPHRREGERLQVIAVTNFKGGSGKTTTAAHLAQYLALRGYRVLAMDLDPQASMTSLFGYQPEVDLREGGTLYGAIRYQNQLSVARVIRRTYFPNLRLIPGNIELQEYEYDTPRHLARYGTANGPVFSRVADAINSVAHHFDVVVIDCPPQLGFLTLSALAASTGIVLTIHPQMLDVASMSQFLNMLSGLLSAVREAGAELRYDFLRYLVTRYEPHDGPQQQIVGFLRSNFGNLVLENPMVKSTAISEAGLRKQTLYEIGRDQLHRQTYDRAMDALHKVHTEIEQTIHQAWGRAAT